MTNDKKQKKSSKEIEKESISNTEQEDSDLKKQDIEEYQNKILRNFLILILGVIIFVFLVYFLVNMFGGIRFNGIQFNEYRQGDLVFYQTLIPIYDSQGTHISNYNLYLRKDPRKTGKIEFEGNFELKRNMVLNFSDNLEEDLKCEGNEKGDGIIGLATMVRLFEALGTKIIKDPNASCDPENRYIFINIQKGDKTKIQEIQKGCYNLYIEDCEIILGTERFVLEAVEKYQT